MRLGIHKHALLIFVAIAAGTCSSGGVTTGTSGSAIAIDTNARYTIVGVQSGKCVEVANGSTANLAQLQIAACNGNARQQFRIDAQSGGYYHLRNLNSNLCADVQGASTAARTPIIQFTCGSDANQQWSFSDVGA